MRKLNLTYFLLAIVLIVVTASSCRKERLIFSIQNAETYDGLLTHHWFNTFRTLTKKCPGFTPPVAARAFGYAGLTLYETVVYGMPNNQSLQNQLSTGLKINAPDTTLPYNWAVAANAAMAETARLYYANMPESQALAVDQLEKATYNDLRETGGVGDATVTRSKEWGVYVAQTIFEWSKTDGGHAGYTKNFPKDFAVPTGTGKWVPTFPKYLSPMQPTWGNNRTFVPNITNTSQPNAPIAYSEDSASVFYKQAKDVFNAVRNGTAEQRTIAKYWSDDPGEAGTPGGHSVSIATLVLQKEGATLAKCAEVYAKVGMGLSDAFVSCWKSKFVYNYMRPITYIRLKFEPNFVPILETPPFPEFTSGHSVQSAATAKILTDVFGTTYLFTDRTHASRVDIDGTPRSYRNFNEFAGEAAISRFYGGIHFKEAIEAGLVQGSKVGAAIGKLQFGK
jgi:PAP2 superfamily